MKPLLEDLMEHAAVWPEEAQAELVEAIIEIEAKHSGEYRLSDAERQAVRRGLQEMREGKFATKEQVRAIFDRYRRK
jgi:predicted transcriptional regulator